MSWFINQNINILINIVAIIDNAESMREESQSVQSVRRKQVTCNPKINFIHFSAI